MTIKAFAHQNVSIKHNDSSALVLDVSDPGCVSADTEYLTPTGWKRFDAYTPGDQVAQFHPDTREIEFVAPLQYIKKPCAEMIHIAPARGTSQRLSPEHRVLYYMPDGTHGVCSAEEYMGALHAQGPSHLKRKFCVTYSVRNATELPLPDAYIRVMVAVIADGSFSPSATNRCVVRLKKARKVVRLRRILAEAGIKANERVCGGATPGFTVFSFDAPRREKEFTAFWWAASQTQLEIIADELPHWDAAVSPRPSAGIRFSTFIEATAHFAQYAFAAAKRPTSLDYTFRNRTAENRGMMVEYVVHAQADDKLIGPGRKDSVYAAPNKEGFKYCFEVPSSYLLLRHNGYIFATGNTGKTFVRIAGFAKRRKKGGGAMLVLAPRTLLRSVWVNDIKKFAPNLTTSVADAANREKAFAADVDVYITNVDAVKWLAQQKPAFFKKFSELVIDECFPAGTLVDTPYGQRPIALIKTGDLVNTSAGPLPVTNTFVSQSNILVRLELENGTEIYCTENHPIATSEGWRNARDCDGLFAVQLDFHQLAQSRTALLQQTMRKSGFLGEYPAVGTGRNDIENDQLCYGPNPLEQGRILPGNDESQTQCGAQVIGAQTRSPRGEWANEPARDDGTRNASVHVDSATPNSDEPAARKRLPELLQSGLCERPTEESSGNRREFTHIAQTLGCEAGRISGLARVVSVSRHELGGPVHVYNLQVDGPHDYSVENTLVHNCTAFKHHTSQRSKAVAKIAKYFKNRCCMTGTPNSNTITDIWHQVQILDEGKRLGFSFYKFRDAVCTPTQVGRSAQAIRWNDKEGAEEAVFGLLSDIVVRHKFEDCVDIPPNHTYSLDYDLTPKQMRAYLELQDTQMLALQTGKVTARLKGSAPVHAPGIIPGVATPNILAINAAAVATKLLQVASGAVYDGTGGYQVIDTARYEMILDLVEQRKHSLCFFLWKHQRDALIAEADKRGVTYAVIDGSTPDRDRDEIVQGYQAGVYQTIFAHPKSAAHGLTLTKGTATIWSSPTYDLEIFKQGSKRQHRMGQTQKTETIVVIAKDTIEQKVYDLMLGKDARMTNLLDLFGTLTPKAMPVKKVTKKKVMAEV